MASCASRRDVVTWVDWFKNVDSFFSFFHTASPCWTLQESHLEAVRYIIDMADPDRILHDTLIGSPGTCQTGSYFPWYMRSQKKTFIDLSFSIFSW